MNYIKQLNAFYTRLDFEPISVGAIAMYSVLLHIANISKWQKEFKVANNTLISKCSINISALQRYRNELIQKRYINYKKRKESK